MDGRHRCDRPDGRCPGVTRRPVMIFHVAYRLDPNAGKASSIRPLRMRRAFEDIGYDVHEVSGTHEERREQIRELRQQVRAGLPVEFVYSEASTTPTGLGEKVTRATSLRRDIAFLRFCQRSGIPVGLFYRDAYWRFPIYDDLVRWPVRTVLRGFYRWDLWRYRRAGLRIYLPSMRMAEWLPILKRDRMRELPPGGEPRALDRRARGDKTALFYVGGLGDNYRLHESVAEIAGRDDTTLTICVPEAQWEDRKHEYLDRWADNITVVHASGPQLDALYAEADACLMAVDPIIYWGFAAPVKLFEAVSRGKPIITSSGTYAGDFVTKNRLGWAVEYGTGALSDVLDQLRKDPALLDEAGQRVAAIRSHHTWEARARAVAEDLGSTPPTLLEAP